MSQEALQQTRAGVGAPSRWPSWVAVIAGIWFIVSPFVLGVSDEPEPLWNNIAVGIVVAALALVATLTAMAWAKWVYGVVGIWGIVSPFALSFDADAVVWSNVIAGIVIVILAVVTWLISRETI